MSRKLKNICCGILLLSLSLNVLPLSAQNFKYNYKGINFKCKVKAGSVVITGFDTEAEDVTIPAVVTVKNTSYPVKEVSTFINGNNYSAYRLVLEEGIERIDNSSFLEFRKLREVVLPSTMKIIEKRAFRKNLNLTFKMPSNINEADLLAGREIWVDQIKPSPKLKQNALAQTKISLEKSGKSPKAGTRRGETKKKTAPTPNAEEKPEPIKEIQKSLASSDIDTDIPVTSQKSEHTYCAIIANEDYENSPNVNFAMNDGEAFYQYCIKTLGVPENQIKFYPNASFTDTRKALRFLESIQIFDKQAKLVLYYSGHGMPDEADKTAYLLPVDGTAKDMSTCLSMKEVYQRLGRIEAASVTVLLDACFCGLQRGKEEAILAARGVAMAAKTEELSGKVVVFTAASDKETALAYDKKQHGLFTYYLLRKLKETKGNVSFGDLVQSVTQEVSKTALLENEKTQRPTHCEAPAMKATWRDIRL